MEARLTSSSAEVRILSEALIRFKPAFGGAGAHPPRPYLQLRDVHIQFGSKKVLDGITFSVMSGQTVCVIGRSGVGKSVSLRIIMGFLKPDNGRVIVAGEEITGYSDKEMEHIRRRVTMVFQSGALFDSLTVAENVAFPLRAREGYSDSEITEIVNELLRLVGLQSARDRLPAEMSVGLKRAVAIARALAAKPQAILYDEPTTMVDPIMARRLVSLIAKLKNEMKLTSVVVTHDMRVVEKLAEDIVFFDDGHVVFDGSFAEMQRSNLPIVREFLELDKLDLSEIV